MSELNIPDRSMCAFICSSSA